MIVLKQTRAEYLYAERILKQVLHHEPFLNKEVLICTMKVFLVGVRKE